jgi:tRNA(Ile)-lysidine synthase
MERAALRHWLGSNGIGWHDDPMNTEDRFARVRVRNLIPALQDAGIPGNRIAAAAGHLARARAALEIATDALLDEATEPLPGGGVVLDAETLLTMPREIGLRALARILMDVSGAAYRPRFERLVRLFDALPEFRSGRTLHGCRILPAPRTKALFGPSSVLIIPEAALKPTARSLRNRVGR